MINVFSLKQSINAVLLCCLLLLSGLFPVLFSVLYSPTASASALTTIKDPSFRTLLNNKVEIFHDNENLDYNQVRSKEYATLFSPVIGDSIHQGFNGGTLWIRFSLKNATEREQQLFIELLPNTLEFDLYAENAKLVFPRNRLAAEMPRIANITLPASPAVAVFYVRVSSTATLNPDIYISSADRLIEKHITDSRINHFIVSCFILLALICFVLSFAYQNKSMLTYGVYNLSWILLLLYGFHYIMPPSFLKNYTSTLSLATALNSTILLCFAYQFLESLFINKTWNRLFLFLFSINIVTIAACVIFSSGSMFFTMLSITIPTQVAIIFTSSYFYFRYQSFAALMLAISKLANLLILSLIFSFNIERSDRFLVNDNTAFIGCLIESLLMTFALVFHCIHQNEKRHQQNLMISVTEAQSSGQQNLLAKLTHEFRTPLSGILGMTELLRETELSVNQKDQVNTIQNSGEALLEMIEKIATETQMESGQLTINYEKFDLPSLLADSIAHYQNRAEDKNIELILDVSEDTPVFVNNDQQRLQQVILRILDFILTLNLESELVLKARKKYQDTEFEFSFTCTGFQRSTFQNLLTNNSRSDLNNLEIASHLVQLMGGKLELFSWSDREHAVSFALPLTEVQETLPPSTEFLLSNLQHKRLLAVDDNKTCLDIIEQQSRTWGMIVNSCLTGQEALALLRSKNDLGEPVDMVITDYLMPGMDGLELAHKIQEDEKIPNKPAIIMLTGVNHVPKNAISDETGIQRIIKKPVTGNKLRVMLAEEFALGQDKHQNMEPGTPTSLNGIRILVAEDNKVNAQVITTMLKKLGAETSIAQNGQHAVEKEMCEKYHVILMDCEMPVMDGFEATRIIRKNQQKSNRNKTPIIALTAHIMEKNLERCLHAGMNAHMSKPVSINELKDLILRTLHNNE